MVELGNSGGRFGLKIIWHTPENTIFKSLCEMVLQKDLSKQNNHVENNFKTLLCKISVIKIIISWNPMTNKK